MPTYQNESSKSKLKTENRKPAPAATGAGFLLKRKERCDALSLLPFSNLTAERRCFNEFPPYFFTVRRSKRSRLLRLQAAWRSGQGPVSTKKNPGDVAASPGFFFCVWIVKTSVPLAVDTIPRAPKRCKYKMLTFLVPESGTFFILRSGRLPLPLRHQKKSVQWLRFLPENPN